jgi:hypothetical protein
MEIERTTFGTITIDGKTYEHDVIIRLSGEVVKRKKKLSKKYYATSHVLSKDEAKSPPLQNVALAMTEYVFNNGRLLPHLTWERGRGWIQKRIAQAFVGYGPVLTTRQLAEHVHVRVPRLDKRPYWSNGETRLREGCGAG